MANEVLKKFAAVLATGVVLASCAMKEDVVVAPQPQRVEAPTPPKPVALTEEAAAALLAAEQRVTEARLKRSLWIAAVEHLDKARAAAKVFDSELTLVHAKETIELCLLSIAQLQSPPVKWKAE